MRALTATSYDGPAAMTVTEHDVPRPGSGQVAIDVTHAGLGFVDGMFASGFMRMPLPYVPGLEVVGTVRALGEGVDGPEPGHQVAALLMPGGRGCGDVVVAPADLVVPVPADLDPVTAAATCTNTITALAALERIGSLGGARVLVHAGVGGVGSQFGQVARVLGAEHVGAVVGSPSKAQAATALGYDAVYLREDMAQVPTGAWDLVVDPVGGGATRAGLEQVAAFGTLLRVGNASREEPVQIDSLDLWLRGVAVVGFNLGGWALGYPAQTGSHLRRALELVANETVRVEVTRQVPLAQAGNALQDVLDGRTRGKVVAVLRG
ncbi:NADPH:quinone reductase [Actinomyces sp. 2119]|uniref:quinone oxidoreductase family protein n=1 Tax=Actinomyces sp. 2119 TaxID=2321393 RepID=UPI000E6C158C|nr:zinc-binding dehydrogenase [Actinomyces sp. 2119]RJF43773.1 NADPH:quinone reductase [Actinomyces sp. 2119]